MVKKLKISRIVLVLLLLPVLFAGCRPKDYSKIPAYSKNNVLQAVVEIPAGTNLKISYCQMTHRFRVEMIDGVEQKIEYLPYPVNFGFIPSTRIDLSQDNVGEMLDVMVICDKLSIGEVVEIIPLGMLLIKDDFQTDYNIIAIPVSEKWQIVHASSLEELKSIYPALTNIVESWFLNSHLYRNPVILGWEDEHVAQQFIDKWII